MQAPKRHLPVVGIIGLIIVAASGGGIYYYQFLLPHNTTVAPVSHRMIFMTAVVQEEGGFHVTNTAFLNQTTLPMFKDSTGYNLTGVKFQDYKQGSSDNKTINASVGDTLTFYIKGINASSTNSQLHVSNAHGFQISGPGSVSVSNGALPGTIPFGKWYTVTVTFTVAGTYLYFCNIVCSPEHGIMNGNIVVS
jgi:plastocyanin